MAVITAIFIDYDMKPIRTKLHGLLDYGSAIILILPWMLNFHLESIGTYLFFFIGSFTLIISLFTDYELGLIKLIPIKVHLLLDVCSSLFLIAIPFIFPLHNYYLYWPVLFGSVELVIVLLSSPMSYITLKRDLDITKPY